MPLKPLRNDQRPPLKEDQHSCSDSVVSVKPPIIHRDGGSAVVRPDTSDGASTPDTPPVSDPLQEVRRRLATGFYDGPEVLNRLAELLGEELARSDDVRE